MALFQNPSDSPPQLNDALARIAKAKEDFHSLYDALDDFIYDYFEGMVKGVDAETGDRHLQLRHPDDSVVKGRGPVLVAQVVENLRTSLDYLVYQLSLLNQPKADVRTPQFVIAGSEQEFRNQAKSRYRYLTDEQVRFFEQIQPYNGNAMLALLNKMTRPSKHRHLLSLVDYSNMRIVIADIEKKDQYPGYREIPFDDKTVLLVRVEDARIILMDRYEVMRTLRDMIEHCEEILSACFGVFSGQPIVVRIVKD